MENALRRIRQARGLEQRELARLAGVSRQALGNIEAGDAEPGTDLALRLARGLRCPVEEIFCLESAPIDVQLASGAAPGRAALAEIAGRWVAHALPDDVLDCPADALL